MGGSGEIGGAAILLALLLGPGSLVVSGSHGSAVTTCAFVLSAVKSAHGIMASRARGSFKGWSSPWLLSTHSQGLAFCPGQHSVAILCLGGAGGVGVPGAIMVTVRS